MCSIIKVLGIHPGRGRRLEELRRGWAQGVIVTGIEIVTVIVIEA